MTRPFPTRPRLADHVLARRHITAGEVVIVLHDQRTGRLVQLGPREWGLLAASDGTRDLEGIVLAARREGAHARVPALQAFLEQLHGADLLADGAPDDTAAEASEPDRSPEPEPESLPADRPLDVLPDFSLHCDGSGSCCRIYASVIFGPVEAARARALFPQIQGGGDRHEKVFLPDHGSAPTGGSAVTLVDGRCAYLGETGHCAIHARAGGPAKPIGCNLFPASFLDDGERVAVSASVECACILASVGRPGGAPLIAPEARFRGDLDPSVFVASLPSHLAITYAVRANRADVRAWSRRIEALSPPSDVARTLWSLAAAIDEHGLDAAPLPAFEAPLAIAPSEIHPWFEALARRAARRAREDAVWRSERDLARLATSWIAEAAEGLVSSDVASIPASTPAVATSEAFYLRAALHGYKLFGDLPLTTALRDRAVRLLVARALPDVFARAGATDPACAYPLALVEAMLRGHGLDGYAHDLDPPAT
ncbi:MAG: YkgJ family cysteine cluster protein [Byssovorax sp.]